MHYRLTYEASHTCQSFSLVFFTHPYSGLTSIAMFLFTREVWNTRAGLFAAGFIAIVPGYISRSVAGSYDNEGIAIFALMFTYYLWIKSLKTGSVFWATATSLSYFYMVHYIQCYVLLMNWLHFILFIRYRPGVDMFSLSI